MIYVWIYFKKKERKNNRFSFSLFFLLKGLTKVTLKLWYNSDVCIAPCCLSVYIIYFCCRNSVNVKKKLHCLKTMQFFNRRKKSYKFIQLVSKQQKIWYATQTRYSTKLCIISLIDIILKIFVLLLQILIVADIYFIFQHE